MKTTLAIAIPRPSMLTNDMTLFRQRIRKVIVKKLCSMGVKSFAWMHHNANDVPITKSAQMLIKSKPAGIKKK